MGTSLRLSWSPLGVQETSRTSKSDAKSLAAAKLSSKLAFGVATNNDFHLFFNGLMNIYVLILRSFSELSKGSVELFWATLTFILALKKLLGGSLGAANGSLRAHNHSTDFMDRNFGALEDLVEAFPIS